MIEPWEKNFTFQIKDDKVFYRNGADMKEVKMLCKIRDLTRRLIDLQKTEISDEKLVPLRESLNRAYDEFEKNFGDDSDYPIVKSLECYDKENENYQKADIFSKRTVNPVAEIKSVETAEKALQVSLDRKGKPEFVHDFFCQLVHIEFYSSVGCRFVQIQFFSVTPTFFQINSLSLNHKKSPKH